MMAFILNSKFLLINPEEKKLFFHTLKRFLRKTKFSESLLFHSEMLGRTNFLLDISVCIVNALIFINKY